MNNATFQPNFNYNVLEAAKSQLAAITEVRTVPSGLLGSHHLYHIKIQRPSDYLSGSEGQPFEIIERRFSDFEAFHAKIKELYKAELLPALPKRKSLKSLKSLAIKDGESESVRREDLELYLNKLLSNKTLASFDETRVFFSRAC